LEEADLYRFLEAEGHHTFASDFRSQLHTLGIYKEESNRQFSFIIFAMWFYKKDVSLLVPVEGSGEVDPHAIAALEEALAAYQKVVDARRERENKIAKLQETAALGGVKGLSAKSELDQMFADDQLARNKAEISAAAKRRLAQKAVDAGSDGAAARERALKQEMAKVEAEKKKKEEAEKKEQEEKRNKLKAKAAMFDHPPEQPPVVVKGKPSTQPAKKWGNPSTNPNEEATHSTHKNVESHSEEKPHHSQPSKAVVSQPHASNEVKAKAKYDYVAGTEKEISLKVDQILVIHTQDSSGWWEAENSGGERGWVPSGYVEII